MDITLLDSKLNIPAVRPDLVPRSRLIARLQSGLPRKLTLVSAPAGYGKTTLLAGWVRQLQQEGLSVAWLSLGMEDSDPARFVRYLVAAFRQIAPLVGDSTLSRLGSAGATQLPGVLAPLVNELSSVPEDMVLVLDDYHALHGLEVHEITAFLLEHLPPKFHLVIATREDPPLPLARLRARAQVCELRVADICFTMEEASLFLQNTMGLSLSASQVASLEKRTEGWVAGLQLAALSMQGLADVSGFISAFTGANRFVLDYLSEEVFGNQPPDVQLFLLHTCAAGRLCASLCDALLSQEGGASSQAMLEQLERANLFLAALDSERRWYRYHQLFADLLQARLKAQQPDLLPELHRRAARWLEQNGLGGEAIEHALAASDFPYAARLISQMVSRLSQQHYGLGTLLRWVEAIPADVVRSDPRLAVAYAWILTSTGQTRKGEEIALGAEQQLEASDVGHPSAETRRLLGEIASIMTLLSVRSNNLERAVAMSGKALDLLPAENGSERAAVMFFLADGYVLAGRLDLALNAYAGAVTLSSAAGDDFSALVSLHSVATLHVLLGHLHDAAAIYRRAIGMIGSTTTHIAGMSYIGLGQVLAEWGRLEEAIDHLMRGIEMLRPISDWNTNLMEGFATLIRVRRLRGDDFTDALRQVRGIAEGAGRERITRPAEWISVLKWLSDGEVARAVRWAADSEREEHDLPAYQREMQQIMLARVYLAAGDAPTALERLAMVVVAAEASGRKGVQIEALSLRALALQALGRTAGAVETVGRALALAEPDGYTLTFIEHGTPMQGLFKEAIRRGIAPAYAAKLLSHPAWLEQPDGGMRHEREAVEHLSDREKAVLVLLVSGFSGPEIARQLVVGSSTVKTHLKSIYSKLNVHTRDQAIARAWELHLV